MTPLDFAYEHFGRHIAPKGKTAWLYTPGWLTKDGPSRKAGERNAGMGGTVIWIAESGARVYGPDYREMGFAASGGSDEGRKLVAAACLQVPQETWLAVVFGKPGADPSRLVLNAKGGSITGYYDTKYGVRLFQPQALARAAEGFTGLSVSEVMDALRIVEAQRSERLYSSDVSLKDLQRLGKLRAKCPTATRAAGTFLRAGTMRAGVLVSYLKETRHGA